MFMGKTPFEEGELDTYFHESQSVSLTKKEHDDISKRIQKTITRPPSKVWRFTLSTMRVAFMFSLIFLSGAFIYQNVENESIHNLFNPNHMSSENDDFGVIEPIGIHHPDSIKMERVNGRPEWSFTGEGMKHVFLPLNAHETIDDIVRKPYFSVYKVLGKGVEVHADYRTSNDEFIQIVTRMHSRESKIEEEINELLNDFPTSGTVMTISGKQAVLMDNEYSPPQLFIVTSKYTYYVMGSENVDTLIELAELIDFDREH